MILFGKENLKYYLFITLATLYIGLGFTSADFFTSPIDSIKDCLILFSQWGILVVALWTVIYLLSLNKYIFAVIYPIIAFFSSILMYFRYTSGTILTTMILDAALDNDQKVTYELISPALFFLIILSTFISLLFVFYRIKKIKLNYIWQYTVPAILLFLIIFNIPRFKAPMAERIPFNLYFITSRYLSEKKEILTERKMVNKEITCNENDSLFVVFILGESLRADHLGLNGYERNTTPLLMKEDIISFTNIYSEFTYTNGSVPHILTRADSINSNPAYEERSFIDLFKQCGFYTSWLANQESARSYVYFMNECDTLVYNNINKSPYVFDKWLDEDLLPTFEELIQKEALKQLVIMHTIGSHWYYNAHFSEKFQVYNPITKSRIVKSNTPEEMINSYDNTILYTDYFITTVIDHLREKNAVLIYLSDHAEALGEENVWLHATDVKSTHYPACFVWMSEMYKIKHPDKYNTAIQNKDRYYRTDFLYPSILEAADIKSDVIDQSLSIFR